MTKVRTVLIVGKDLTPAMVGSGYVEGYEADVVGQAAEGKKRRVLRTKKSEVRAFRHVCRLGTVAVTPNPLHSKLGDVEEGPAYLRAKVAGQCLRRKANKQRGSLRSVRSTTLAGVWWGRNTPMSLPPRPTERFCHTAEIASVFVPVPVPCNHVHIDLTHLREAQSSVLTGQTSAL